MATHPTTSKYFHIYKSSTHNLFNSNYIHLKIYKYVYIHSLESKPTIQTNPTNTNLTLHIFHILHIYWRGSHSTIYVTIITTTILSQISLTQLNYYFYS